MDDLNKMDLVSLKIAAAKVKKLLKYEEEDMLDIRNYFIENNEVWVFEGFKTLKAKELKDEKTGKLKHNDKDLAGIKNALNSLSKLRKKKNELDLMIIKRELGEDYFDQGNENVNPENELIKTYVKACTSLEEFLKKLKEETVYTYVLITDITYYDEEKGDKNFLAAFDVIKKDENPERAKSNLAYVLPFPVLFSENEIKVVPAKKKPEPKEVILNVNSLRLSKKQKKVAVLIKEQLEEKPGFGIVNLNKVQYKITEEKDNEVLNYYLYTPFEYFAYIESIKAPLNIITKKWNDEEYLRLKKELIIWSKKEKSSDLDEYVNYLNEVTGKFHKWYLEKRLDIPELVISEPGDKSRNHESVDTDYYLEEQDYLDDYNLNQYDDYETDIKNKKIFFITRVRGHMKTLLKDKTITLKTQPAEIEKKLHKHLSRYREYRNVKRVINKVKQEIIEEKKKRKKS